MSRYYAEIQGSRGKASRMGTKSSGITSHTRGWNVGVRVTAVDDQETDAFHIEATGGSNYPSGWYVGTVRLDGQSLVFINHKGEKTVLR